MYNSHSRRSSLRTFFALSSSILATLVLCTAISTSAQNSPPNTEAKLISIADADYPRVAREAFVSGNVNVRIDVDNNGHAINAMVVYGPGPVCPNVAMPAVAALKDAAVAAALHASYSPEPSIQMVTVEFKPAEGTPRPRMISGGVLNGKATSLPTPTYPQAAMAVGASGTVSIQVTISEDGTVYSAQAVSGHPLLRFPSEQAACSARFSPTLLSGVPVRVTGIITYNFNP